MHKTIQKDSKKTGTNGTPGDAARGKTIGNDTGKFWNKYTCRIYSKKSKDSGNIAIFVSSDILHDKGQWFHINAS